MATIIEQACEGRITPEMEAVAQREQVEAAYVRDMIAAGKIIIPLNTVRKSSPVGIGKGLATKVNASIGTSSDIVDIDAEIRKARAAEECGADTLMELSVGGDLDRIRREVLAAVELPVGNVPLYQAFCEASRKYKDPNKLSEEMLFDCIEKQCADGISFMAIHCGINLYTVERLKKQGYRYGGLVSKGGTTMVGWMLANKRENHLYEKFDRVVALLKKYDVVLSLGNGLRAGTTGQSIVVERKGKTTAFDLKYSRNEGVNYNLPNGDTIIVGATFDAGSFTDTISWNLPEYIGHDTDGNGYKLQVSSPDGATAETPVFNVYGQLELCDRSP